MSNATTIDDRRVTNERMINELRQMNTDCDQQATIIKRQFSSPLFRPPHGWMRTDQYLYLRKKFTIIMWDLVTRDYSNRLTADEVYENVKNYTRPGSIITFHDSLKSIEKLRTALPRSIEWLQSQGYQFKVFDEDQERSRHLK